MAGSARSTVSPWQSFRARLPGSLQKFVPIGILALFEMEEIEHMRIIRLGGKKLTGTWLCHVACVHVPGYANPDQLR